MDSMDFNQTAKTLLSATFKVAKTMPKIPHAYTLRETWGDDELFDEVVRYIRKFGYRQNFFKQIYTYLDINGYQYWTMGAPIDETILINRAKIEPHSPYDAIAQMYDGLFDGLDFQQEDQDLIKKLNITGRVLDVGCGTGLLLDYIQPEDYVGVDNSQNMLDQLKEKHPLYADKVICTPAESFYDLKGFDTIVSLYGSASYIDPDHVERLVQLLNPGGKAYFMYYKEGYKVYTHGVTGIRPEYFSPDKKGEVFSNYEIVTYE